MCRVSAPAPDAQPDVNLTAAASRSPHTRRSPAGPRLRCSAATPSGRSKAKRAGRQRRSRLRPPARTARAARRAADVRRAGQFDYVPSRPEKRSRGPKRSPAHPRRSARARSARDHARRLRSADRRSAPLLRLRRSQNGGTLRVIVLDNSRGSLEASVAGSALWLKKQLEGNAHAPVVCRRRYHRACPCEGGPATAEASPHCSRLRRAGGVHDRRRAAPAKEPRKYTNSTNAIWSPNTPAPERRRSPSTKARRSATSSRRTMG